MRVLITGYSGFIGSNLTAYLQDFGPDFHVTGFSRSGLPQPGVHEIITEIPPQFDFDAVIHLAGKAHELRNSSNPEAYFQVNTEFTKQVFDKFISSPGKIFIFLSSVKAAADHLEVPLTENVVPAPATPYGQSKLQAENYILSQNGCQSRSVYVLRPSMVHGPNNKGNLNLLYNFVKKGWPYPLGKFDNKRSFLSVTNLCFTIHALLQGKIPSGIYNISDDRSLSTTRLVHIISEELGKKPRMLPVPRIFIRAVAKVGDLLRLPVNSTWLTKLTADFEVDNTKITAELKSRLPYDAEEGLRRTIRSFQKK